MQTWQELGEIQPLATKIMTNSIEKNRISHAYVIQGARGTGKKSLAKLLAKTLFCVSMNDLEPCQSCPACKRIDSGNHPDVHWVEPEGNSIKNDQIKLLRQEFAYTGYESAKKVYIISAAETLTVNAANRILKFLEEPEVETTAILLTDNVQGILSTIQSRCQIIDLKPLEPVAFQHRLVDVSEMTITENNARFLSALTNNIDEAVMYHEEGKIYQLQDLVQEFIYMILTRYEERYLFIHQKWFPNVKDKKEQEQGIDLLLLALKDIINYQIGREANIFLFNCEDGLLKRAANELSQETILRMMKAILDARQKLKQNIHPTLLMEQLVLQF